MAIRSLFFTDSEDKAVNRLYVDKTYRTHVVIECMKDAPSLIVGFVLENNKGLPLFDINNFINQGEVVNGHSLSMKCLPGFMVLWNWKS